MVDVYVNFNCGYLDVESHELVLDISKIHKRYLKVPQTISDWAI
jgi:hypothetical protein